MSRQNPFHNRRNGGSGEGGPDDGEADFVEGFGESGGPLLDERFADWVDDRLTPEELEDLEAELAADDELAAQARSYLETVLTLRKQLRDVDPPAGLVDAVLAELPGARRRAAVFPLVAGLAAVAAMVVVFVLLDDWSQPPAVSTESTARLETEKLASEKMREEGKAIAKDSRDEFELAPAEQADSSSRAEAPSKKGMKQALTKSVDGHRPTDGGAPASDAKDRQGEPTREVSETWGVGGEQSEDEELLRLADSYLRTIPESPRRSQQPSPALRGGTRRFSDPARERFRDEADEAKKADSPESEGIPSRGTSVLLVDLTAPVVFDAIDGPRSEKPSGPGAPGAGPVENQARKGGNRSRGGAGGRPATGRGEAPSGTTPPPAQVKKVKVAEQEEAGAEKSVAPATKPELTELSEVERLRKSGLAGYLYGLKGNKLPSTAKATPIPTRVLVGSPGGFHFSTGRLGSGATKARAAETVSATLRPTDEVYLVRGTRPQIQVFFVGLRDYLAKESVGKPAGKAADKADRSATNDVRAPAPVTVRKLQDLPAAALNGLVPDFSMDATAAGERRFVLILRLR